MSIAINLASACKPLPEFAVITGMMGVVADQLAIESSSPTPHTDFAGWVSSEQKRVFLLCNRMLQDPEEASSATQDVFFKAFKGLDSQIEEPCKWLTRIAVNVCLDRLRSRRWQFWRRRPSIQTRNLALATASTHAPDAEDQLFAQQIQARLHVALDRLSDRQRAVFTLKHFEDRSLEDIGQILGVDVGTVKAHMFRAVGKLRNELIDLYRVSRG